MAAFGVLLLQHLGPVTGQTAGLALLISIWTGYAFGPVFFVLNLPFYWLAWSRMGRAFTFRTFAAVALVSGFAHVLPQAVSFGAVVPPVGAALAGMIAGAGLLALFRHGASVGGVGVLAVYLQDRFKLRAGATQMAVDLVIFGFAVLVLDPWSVAWSLLGAAVLNAVIAINHRRDRYMAL